MKPRMNLQCQEHRFETTFGGGKNITQLNQHILLSGGLRHLPNNLAKECSTCAVCQEALYQSNDENDDSLFIFQLPCSHRFHTNCLQPWLGFSKSCPTCRHDVAGSPRRGAGTHEPNVDGLFSNPFIFLPISSPEGSHRQLRGGLGQSSPRRTTQLSAAALDGAPKHETPRLEGGWAHGAVARAARGLAQRLWRSAVHRGRDKSPCAVAA